MRDSKRQIILPVRIRRTGMEKDDTIVDKIDPLDPKLFYIRKVY